MAEESVLAAFKKFDADGSGAISREELGEVLQALKDADPWEDEEIDEMLAAADTSGDGELQVEEFVKWVFAEDKEISQGVKTEAKITIAGCSRGEFNGEYKQKEGDFYHRKPVFYCEEQKKYLFYHKGRKQRSIFKRTGTSASCRIQTTRSAHQPGEGKVWAVYKHKSPDSKKKGMVKEPEMTCTAEVAGKKAENAEELLAQAEPCVKFDEIFYKKIDGVMGNRAVYRRSEGDEWGDTYMFYEKAEKYWKRGNELAEGKPSLNISRSTSAASPEKASWFDETGGGQISVIQVDTDGIPNNTGQALVYDASVEAGYKDASFPHEKSSLGNTISKKIPTCRWLRARALHQYPVLFADAEPCDVLQGSVGNCWLVAAMSAVAEFPSYLRNNIFLNKKVAKDGQYSVKLYCGKTDRWKIIEIDDYLPCTSWGGNRPSLLFGKISDGKLCFVLLEKAFAKMYGSYAALQGGYQPVAWFHLTGCKQFFRYKHSYSAAVRWRVIVEEGCTVYSTRWKTEVLGTLAQGALFYESRRIGAWIQFKKKSGEGPDTGYIQYYRKGKRTAMRYPLYDGRIFCAHMHVNPSTVHLGIRGDKEKGQGGSEWSTAFSVGKSYWVNMEDTWQKLLAYDKGNYLICSSATTVTDESGSGIVHGHAYSVLHCAEVAGVRLVSLRNPWGDSSEWSGPWSDKRDEWKYNPEIAKALNVDFQGDGVFWMDFEDFMYVFGRFFVMNCQMPTSRADFHKQLVDVDDEGPGGTGDNDFDDEDDDDDDYGSSRGFGGQNIWVTPPKKGGRLTACFGLDVDWNAPALMENGTLLHPGDHERSFQNVPTFLEGLTYIGHPFKEDLKGNWTWKFEPPCTCYIWLLDGMTNSLELVLPTTGWTEVSAPGFQTSDGYKLWLFSKSYEKADFYTGCYDSARVAYPPFCGGLIGTYPLPKEPKMKEGDEELEHCSSPPSGPLGCCTGLETEWCAPQTMEEGMPVVAGAEFCLQNVPAVLLNGSMICSTTGKPSAGTWTIQYAPPCKLYIWVEEGDHNCGVDDALCMDGWAWEPADGFNLHGKGLHLWGRHFLSGESYCLDVEEGLMAGVVGQPLNSEGCVDSCSGLDIEWNPPKHLSEGVYTNPGDRDFTFEAVPDFMAGGSYIGTRTWPKAGTWTIEYTAPTLLFVWVDKGQYNAGVDGALEADGWTREEVGDFGRRQSGGFNPLTVWSRHFASGSSYSIETTDLMVGGVVSAAAD